MCVGVYIYTYRFITERMFQPYSYMSNINFRKENEKNPEILHSRFESKFSSFFTPTPRNEKFEQNNVLPLNFTRSPGIYYRIYTNRHRVFTPSTSIFIHHTEINLYGSGTLRFFAAACNNQTASELRI